MLAASLRFCTAMTSEPAGHWLTLAGNSGAGKTMLARRVKRFYDQCLSTYRDEATGANLARRQIFANWGTCLSWMLEHDYSFIPDFKRADFLVLDDIGAEYTRMRELSASKLYEILGAREGKWTVITANLSAADIGDKLDVRIASRLLRSGSVVVDVSKLEVPDFNLR